MVNINHDGSHNCPPKYLVTHVLKYLQTCRITQKKIYVAGLHEGKLALHVLLVQVYIQN